MLSNRQAILLSHRTERDTKQGLNFNGVLAQLCWFELPLLERFDGTLVEDWIEAADHTNSVDATVVTNHRIQHHQTSELSQLRIFGPARIDFAQRARLHDGITRSQRDL